MEVEDESKTLITNNLNLKLKNDYPNDENVPIIDSYWIFLFLLTIEKIYNLKTL